MLQVPVQFIVDEDIAECAPSETTAETHPSGFANLRRQLRFPLEVAGNTLAGAALFIALLSLPWLAQLLLHAAMN